MEVYKWDTCEAWLFHSLYKHMQLTHLSLDPGSGHAYRVAGKLFEF